MKKKQFAAFLLSGLLVLNTAIPAFAEGMTEQTAENQTQAEPYQADTEAPKLTSISIKKDVLNAGDTLVVEIEATDDVSGVDCFDVTFKETSTGKENTTYLSDTPNKLEYELSEYIPGGTYEIEKVSIWDNAGNLVNYDKNSLPKPIPSFIVNNTQDKTDTEAPKLTSISIKKDVLNAGDTLVVEIEATDDVSGVDCFDVTFKETSTGKENTTYLSDTPNKLEYELSEYIPGGTYEIEKVSIWDNAGNLVNYDKNSLPKPIPSFIVNNTQDKTDTKAPELTSISIEKDVLNAGDTLVVEIEATDDVSGVDCFDVTFKETSTGKENTTYLSDTPNKLEYELSEYIPGGTYKIEKVSIWDNAGNLVNYDKDSLPKPLLSFTVINDNNNVIPPVKPERPSKPNNSGSSSGKIINYESEKPDPADKKATEMYNFWQNVKRKIKNTEKGKTLRVAVPAEYTYMPASVMETLRLNPQVGLKLSWGKDTIVIKAGTAQPKQKLKAYWTKSALVKLYSQR